MTFNKLAWGVKASFRGYVEASGCMLKSTLAELGIEASDDRLHLTELEGPANKGRCAVAELSSADVAANGAVTLVSKITMDGMWQIADNYPPGTELDPVILE